MGANVILSFTIFVIWASAATERLMFLKICSFYTVVWPARYKLKPR
jgi:hypothetical protein